MRDCAPAVGVPCACEPAYDRATDPHVNGTWNRTFEDEHKFTTNMSMRPRYFHGPLKTAWTGGNVSYVQSLSFSSIPGPGSGGKCVLRPRRLCSCVTASSWNVGGFNIEGCDRSRGA